MDLTKYRIATKELIFNQAPLYVNYDKWLQNENNILWITGISGGGKGFTAKEIAKQYSKESPIIIELDRFENYLWIDFSKKEDNESIAKGNEIIDKYLKDTFGDLTIDRWIDNKKSYQRDLCKFIYYLRDYFDSHKDQKFIVEGIQIFMDPCFDFLGFTDSIIVIKSTKVYLMSKVMHREHNELRNRFHGHDDPQGKLDEFVHKLGVNIDECTKREK